MIWIVLSILFFGSFTNSPQNTRTYLPYVAANGPFIERWDGPVSDRWEHYPGCFQAREGILTARCQSNNILSKRKWKTTEPVFARITLSGRPSSTSTTSNFWVGMALLVSDDPDAVYAELAVERFILPFDDDNANHNAWLVHLSTPAKECCLRIFRAEEGATYEITIDYKPGEAVYSAKDADGRILFQRPVIVDLQGKDAQIDLLCVAENPGTTVPGASTDCTFGQLEVYGTTVE